MILENESTELDELDLEEEVLYGNTNEDLDENLDILNDLEDQTDLDLDLDESVDELESDESLYDFEEEDLDLPYTN